MKMHKRTLWAASKLPADRYDGVELVRLMCLQSRRGPGAVAAEDEGPPEEKLVLVPFALHNPVLQVFWEVEHDQAGPVQVGSIINVPMSLQAFSTEASMSIWMTAQIEGVRLFRLRYKFLSLTRLEVLERGDITAEAEQLAAGIKLDEELALLKLLGREFRPRLRKAGGGRTRERTTVKVEHPGDADDDSSGDDLDEAEPADLWEAQAEWEDAAAAEAEDWRIF